MSGHSKWSTIKRKKGANDAKRGKIFTKIARELQVAAAAGGPDPETNIRLRLVLDKAKGANMPKDNIERAIARGAGTDKSEKFEEITYEGYGPNGVAVMVEVMTDNRNRTVAEIRHAFTKGGGNMASTGAVVWQFDRKGQIMVKTDGMDEDDLFLIAVDAGAEDVDFGDDGTSEIVTAATDLAAVRDSLSAEGIEVDVAELMMVPQTEIELPVQDAMKVMNLIENLEDLDDVQKVYSNLAMNEELLIQLESG
jgi:YebC/PmpR family DNA-binding regulatory protein